MKRIILILTLLFSLAATAQQTGGLLQDTKSNSRFMIYYMGYSQYLASFNNGVGGYYGQITNLTDVDETVTITYVDGVITVDVPANRCVAFVLPATYYTINSKITAVCNTGGSPLTLRARGAYGG